MKVNSVVKQFSLIKKRYNLNIATTAVGYSGSRSAEKKTKETSPTATSTKAIEWHDKETEIGNLETSTMAGKSSRTPKPFKREYDFEYDYDDSEDEDSESKPSPAKKRVVKSVWTSDEESSKQDGYTID
jgi:hypothetical protein